MFGLFRLVIFVLAAFVAGLFFERSQQRQACESAGGLWTAEGFCAMEQSFGG